MRILFLMLHLAEDPEESSMYSDLAEEFRVHGHQVTIMAPDEDHSATRLREERGMRVVRVKTRPVLGVKSAIRKGVALALLTRQFRLAYEAYLNDERFDWVFMPTPPITLVDFVAHVKRKANARFYLILRDIHPQSMASIGLIKWPFMYSFLARKAARGYALADLIGCMSPGNIEFIAAHYPELDRSKLVLLMNWQKEVNHAGSQVNVREAHGLQDKFIVLFGGNIGVGQRIENFIKLARHYRDNPRIVFLVIGKGVKKAELERMANEEQLRNIVFMGFMPREDYLEFARTADVGLISINENYAVPTCPSKAVSYMSLKVPIFAMINPDSDYGQYYIEDAGAGFWAVGSDDERVFARFDKMYADRALRKAMGENGHRHYLQHLTSERAYLAMMNQIDAVQKT